MKGYTDYTLPSTEFMPPPMCSMCTQKAHWRLRFRTFVRDFSDRQSLPRSYQKFRFPDRKQVFTIHKLFVETVKPEQTSLIANVTETKFSNAGKDPNLQKAFLKIEVSGSYVNFFCMCSITPNIHHDLRNPMSLSISDRTRQLNLYNNSYYYHYVCLTKVSNLTCACLKLSSLDLLSVLLIFTASARGNTIHPVL
jgi:hypothetical protein